LNWEIIAAAYVLHNFIIIDDELNIQDKDYLYDEDMEIEEVNNPLCK